MKRQRALAVIELRRIASGRRWVTVPVTSAIVALLASADVAATAANAGQAPGALDVHAAAANNLMYVGYLLFTAVMLVVGDTVIMDRPDGFARLVIGRGTGRGSWWLGKSLAVLVVAGVANAALLVFCVLVGNLWRGWSATSTPSQLAIAKLETRGLMLFPPVGAHASMLARQAAIACYLTLAFWALALFILALTLKAQHAAVPVAVALFGLMADYVLAKAWEPWALIGPGARLLEATHSPLLGAHAPPMWTSVVYFSAVLAISGVAGLVAVRRLDL